MPTAVDAVRVLRAAGGVSVCAGLSAVSDKFGLTTDHNESEEVPGLVEEADEFDKEEDAFGDARASRTDDVDAKQSGEVSGTGAARLSAPKVEKTRVLYNFGEHGRELITVEVAVDLLRALAGGAESAARLAHPDASESTRVTARALLATTFKIVPMENVNGRDKVEAGEWCERKNGRGVDCNRNWEVDWGVKAPDYDPSEEYPGTAPFSEPEAFMMKTLLEEFAPHVWVNVHSGMEAQLRAEATDRDGEDVRSSEEEDKEADDAFGTPIAAAPETPEGSPARKPAGEEAARPAEGGSPGKTRGGSKSETPSLDQAPTVGPTGGPTGGPGPSKGDGVIYLRGRAVRVEGATPGGARERPPPPQRSGWASPARSSFAKKMLAQFEKAEGGARTPFRSVSQPHMVVANADER